jgi:hypothetical protein
VSAMKSSPIVSTGSMTKIDACTCGLMGSHDFQEAVARNLASARISDIRDGVCLLHEQPAARLERGDQPVEGSVPFRKVDQNGAGVHEVKCSPLKFVAHDVVATHFEIRKVERFQEPRVDIGGHHAPRRAYSPAEPFSD